MGSVSAEKFGADLRILGPGRDQAALCDQQPPVKGSLVQSFGHDWHNLGRGDVPARPRRVAFNLLGLEMAQKIARCFGHHVSAANEPILPTKPSKRGQPRAGARVLLEDLAQLPLP